jgi:NRAMP (natural resistance-associated macrophage protein)-like metal ion transporter
MKTIKKLLSLLGPGFVTGAADDDPSGIATYAQTGAQFGFSQLWTSLFSFPLMTCIQEMCGRIGMITNKGLIQVIKSFYTKKLLYLTVSLLFIANTFNIGADLGAMAEALQLIVPVPFYLSLIAIAVGSLLLEVFIPYAIYARYLKYLTLALFSYIATLFFIRIEWGEVIYATFVPHLAFTKDYLMNITAILGTTISPYLFFWQANQEVEERQQHNITQISQDHINNLRIDTVLGMLFSNLIMWFIITATGATLFKNGIHHITSGGEAALALKPFAGDFSCFIFAIGILGTGLLAIPILAGSVAYAVAEMMSWPCSLALTYGNGKKFYHVIAITIIIGALINFLPINSITLLYYSAVLNGLIAPILIFIILSIANNQTIMGKHVNGPLAKSLGLFTGIIMSIVALSLAIAWVY